MEAGAQFQQMVNVECVTDFHTQPGNTINDVTQIWPTHPLCIYAMVPYNINTLLNHFNAIESAPK